ncbi:MAG: hypothetical protein J6C43_03785, partial [Oscillospiraceae bacterium]|nr:hypothetical protein [Oscillospiraceae bacterium]
MSKKYSLFLTILFCGFLGSLAAANALTPDRDFSEVENRPLAQKPAFSAQGLLSGDFMSDYESYVTDQFPGRDGWTAAKAYAEKLVGKQENNGVYFCEGGALISRFDAPEEKRLTNNAKYVAQFAEKAGVPVTFGLIPTQAYIWADKLPQGAPNYDQRQVYTDVTNALPDTITLADSLWSTLSAHKDEAIFYRTDHHWTSLGAYYGYTAVMEALGLSDEILPLDSYTKTTVSTEFYGTVFSTSGVRWVEPDEMDVYVPEEGITVTSYNPTAEPRQLYDESFLDKKDKYSMFLGGQQPLGVIRTGNTDKPKLLLIRDSYSDSLAPFL